MTLYAFDAIDDAISATRTFLWPFDFGRWARLALVMFFVGGTGGFNPFQGNLGGTGGGGGGGGVPGGPGAPDVAPSLGGIELAVVAAVLGFVFLIVIVLLLVGSIMEFVLVESLRREEVTIRRYWGERWGQGLRLAGFRVGLFVVTVALLAPFVYLLARPLLEGNVEAAVGIGLLSAPFLLVVWAASGLVAGFTTVFVVPVMVVEDRAVLAGWRRLWPTLREQWRQYAVYAVMGLVLQFAAGILSLIAWLFLLLAVLLVFGVLAVVGFLLSQAAGPVGLVVLAVALLLGALSLVIGGLFIQVPIQTYLRYYALFVLGDTAEAFDLIPERRAAVRGNEAEG